MAKIMPDIKYGGMKHTVSILCVPKACIMFQVIVNVKVDMVRSNSQLFAEKLGTS